MIKNMAIVIILPHLASSRSVAYKAPRLQKNKMLRGVNLPSMVESTRDQGPT